MTAMIEVEHLRKRYGGTWAVEDVTFAVQPGEIYGILGSNGAGKTTTVECLQGLRRPDGGRTTLGTSRIGSQLQEASLPDRLRVREALRLFSGSDAVPLGPLIDTWGLADHAGKAFADLSGGLRQRLFIALALLNRPELVFFDELTQGLDPTARNEVWQVIRSVRDAGTTVVLVTHFMNEAEALCDRLAVFDLGRIIAEGTPTQIIATHATDATISFLEPAGPIRFDRCPGVRHVSTRDRRVVVEGHPEMVAHVCAALVADGTTPRELSIDQPSLEDAVLAIHDHAQPTPILEGALR